MFDGKRVINGTNGFVWVDDEIASEATALQAKITMKKENVMIAGKGSTSYKVTGWEGKGTIKLNKVTSRFLIKLAADLKANKTTVCTIVSKLADPDAYGAERIALYNVTFDDLTLADWEAGKIGETQAPFTFEGFDLLDTIDPSLLQ